VVFTPPFDGPVFRLANDLNLTGEPLLFYLGIDQHAKQLTVNLRNSAGDAVLRRQVSTQPEKVLEFFESLTRRCAEHQCGFWAIVEVCGFNDWLIEMLKNFRCDRIVLVQPE